MLGESGAYTAAHLGTQPGTLAQKMTHTGYGRGSEVLGRREKGCCKLSEKRKEESTFFKILAVSYTIASETAFFQIQRPCAQGPRLGHG